MKTCPCGIATVDCEYHRPEWCGYCGKPMVLHTAKTETWQGIDGAFYFKCHLRVKSAFEQPFLMVRAKP